MMDLRERSWGLGLGSAGRQSQGSSSNPGQSSSHQSSSRRLASDTMEGARDMLIGALDRVIQLATNQGIPCTSQPSGHSSSSSSSGTVAVDQSAALMSNTRVAATTSYATSRRDDSLQGTSQGTIEEHAREHRQLFGFRRATPSHSFEPPKATVRASGRSYKGKGKRRMIHGARQPARPTWKKSCVCLKSMYQQRKPSAVEKMELAKMGLGLAELSFDYDGDAEHVHSILTSQFPQLESCGGYSLLRLNDNSHDLVEIQYPAKGMSVPYLKDILNQAKLYVRPLQKNITEEETHHQDDDESVYKAEPHEFCIRCDTLLPLSKLTKHVLECCAGDGTEEEEPPDSEEEPPDSEGEPPKKRSCNEEIIDLMSDSDESEGHGSNLLAIAIRKHNARLHETHRITINREKVFEDALVAMNCYEWNGKIIKINFLGEPAIDYGGPTREFFSLLLKTIQKNTSLLDGCENRRVLRHNSTAIQEKKFLALGKMMALSILHGGPGPTFLAPSVVDYLFGGLSMVTASVEDIPDHLTQTRIRQLSTVESTQELRALLDSPEFEFRFQCGVSEPAAILTLEDKKRLVDAFCLHYCVYRTQTELEQMKEGLMVQDFNLLMERHPSEVREAFRPVKKKVDSSLIEELYTSNPSDLAPRGSEKWCKQQGILNAWVCYLRKVEDQPADAVLSLEDVFQFLTGCYCIPPSGFDVEPSIIFDDHNEGDGGFPLVSTCALSIMFPINFPTEQLKFKEMMDLAVLSSKDTFGQL